MNAYLHPSENRGHVNMGWLDSYHSFSFGSWYNPKYMGISALRVINEDRIAGQQGFGTHPHDNMEILTYVLSGTLSHKDSMGNVEDIPAGEWQLMSAGTGITHSEMNRYDEPIHLLQIWLLPKVKNTEPSYQQVAINPFDAPNQWHLIVGDKNAPMQIKQDATVSAAVLEQGNSLDLADLAKGVYYVHVVSGELQIAEHRVATGDALVFSDAATLQAVQDSHVICFKLP